MSTSIQYWRLLVGQYSIIVEIDDRV